MPFEGRRWVNYSRADVQEILGVPQARRGGDWLNGYRSYNDEFFIFCTIGVAGRTGHDYPNGWDNGTLLWSAARNATLRQTELERLVSNEYPVHIFYRLSDRATFIYAGVGHPLEVVNGAPVVVRWGFDDVHANPELPAMLAGEGFTLDIPGRHMQRADRGETRLYVKTSSRSFPLVLSPDWESHLSRLVAVGATRPRDRFYYHNTAMGLFPYRRHTGRQEIPYGIDLGFQTTSILSNILKVIQTVPAAFVPLIPGVEIDPVTETEVTRAARLGQQKFRRDLLERYCGRCALTSVDMADMLRASHIKPWNKSNNRERLDPDNGLLLAIHFDGLFDTGLISFRSDLTILISRRLSAATQTAFGVKHNMRLSSLHGLNDHYLEYHRTEKFIA